MASRRCRALNEHANVVQAIYYHSNVPAGEALRRASIRRRSGKTRNEEATLVTSIECHSRQVMRENALGALPVTAETNLA